MGAFINDTTPELVAERLRAITVPASAADVNAARTLTEGARA